MDPYTRSLELRLAALERYVARLERRIAATLSFARTTTPPNDAGVIQTVQSQLNALSVRDDVPVMMLYGFSSSMPLGGDKIVLHGNGEQASAIAIATNHQAYRFTGLLTGESVMHDAWQHSIRLTEDGVVITGNVTINGLATATGNITAGFGTSDSVTVLGHQHGKGTAAAGTSVPTPGT